MNSIIIRNGLIDGKKQDLLIEGNRIKSIALDISCPHPDTIEIDATDKAVVPGMANCHTHCAMTLFRGYGDDLPLMKWLEEYIWPVEAHMTNEDIYWGAKLGCLEMIKSGTTCFLDMYTAPEATAQAVVETGMRANLSYTLFDRWDPVRAQLDRENCKRYFDLFGTLPDRIMFSVGPHAIYTVSAEQLVFAREFAEEYHVPVHLHLSETQVEVDNCIAKYGTTPVRFLEKIGALSKYHVMAHSLYLDDEELDILAKYGCALVHNPASNMKLASGAQFRYEEMKARGISVGLGTDGTSSSNNLDMYVAMKLAALLGKVWRLDPTAVAAEDIYRTATQEGYKISGLEGGVIAPGQLADLCLVDLQRPEMTPCHNLISNLVYSASGSVVDTTIVDGKILMLHGVVEGEEEIRTRAAEAAYRLIDKYGIKK